MPSKVISFVLNGREVEAMVKPAETVQTLIRERLHYTATKSGCKQGGCGSCTVLLNGEPVLSCLLPAEDIADQEVTTLEGVTPMHGLDPIQQSFADHYATQCGFCTPGMIMVTKALLDHNPDPTRQEIMDAIAGNFCRCTGYQPIIEAIEAAAGHGKYAGHGK
ncbi:MAG: (2Fe-2S)-binding protein [Chloroflexota bacterium]